MRILANALFWTFTCGIFIPLAASAQPFGGIGVSVVPTATGELAVLKVVEDSPAEAGGLLPGDLIIRVDGHSLRGTDFTEVVSHYLWGEPGSRVALAYLRPGREGENKVILERIAMNPDRGQTPGVQIITPDQMGEKGGRP